MSIAAYQRAPFGAREDGTWDWKAEPRLEAGAPSRCKLLVLAGATQKEPPGRWPRYIFPTSAAPRLSHSSIHRRHFGNISSWFAASFSAHIALPANNYNSPYPTGINSFSVILGRNQHHVPPFRCAAGPRVASRPPAHRRQRRQPGGCLQEPDRLEHLSLADPGQSSRMSYAQRSQSLTSPALDTSRGFRQHVYGPGEWCDCQSPLHAHAPQDLHADKNVCLDTCTKQPSLRQSRHCVVWARRSSGQTHPPIPHPQESNPHRLHYSGPAPGYQNKARSEYHRRPAGHHHQGSLGRRGPDIWLCHSWDGGAREHPIR